MPARPALKSGGEESQKMTMKPEYTPEETKLFPPPCQNRTAQQIQNEIKFMRLMYSRRQADNERQARLVGWCLILVAIAVPAIAAAIYLLS